MRNIFKAGDIKEYRVIVTKEDLARFHDADIHPVYSTFALARDAEWTTRQFVLDMKDDGEEGIGTYLQIRHEGPAFVDEEVVFRGIFETFSGGELTCSFDARVGDRVIARGKTGQKILTLEKIRSIFAHE